jgi:hypothetical protein
MGSSSDPDRPAKERPTMVSKVLRPEGADDLFYSLKGKFSGTCAVHRDRAVAWLKQRSFPEA